MASRVTRPGWVVVSVLFHILLVLLVIRHAADFARVGEGNPLLLQFGDGGGGGGGGPRGGYILLPAFVPPPAAPVDQTAPPTETAEPPVVSTPQVERDSLADSQVVATAGSGTGAGSDGGSGVGTGGGQGPGTGPGTGPGSGGDTRGTGPSPRQLIIPPIEDKPRDLAGKTVTVRFFITRIGRVDRIEVDPEIRDRNYARKFRESMVRYTFYPAHSPAGEPIDAVYTVAVGL